MRKGIIYKVTNLINDKCYIGQTIEGLEKRKKRHYLIVKSDGQTYFHRAIRKYGIENFVWEVIYECEDVMLNMMETFKIMICHSHISEGGYNLTWGGDENPMNYPEFRLKVSERIKGVRKTEEHKKKISIAKTGKARSKTSREKQSNSVKGENNVMYGKHHTEETKQKIREKRKYQVITEETRKKMGDVHRGKKLTPETKKKLGDAIRKYDVKILKECIEMRENGMSVTNISKNKNVKISAIYYWMKKKNDLI